MKKFLTIGRNPACDICIPDSTDVVSREHAILEIGKGGKYFLIDKSRNGTYVNGIKMSSNEKIPVTRDDVISFAHVRDLDWSLVPKNNTATIWTVAVLAAILVLGGGAWGISALVRSSQNRIDFYADPNHPDNWNTPGTPTPTDPNSGNQDAASDSEKEETTESEKKKNKPVKSTKPENKEQEKKEQEKKPELIDAIY